MRRLRLGLVVLSVVLTASGAGQADSFVLLRFEQYLDALRQQAGIKALSGAVIQDDTIVWEVGFGLADLENSIRAAPDTPYVVMGLTQTLSAAVLLECAETGRLDLDTEIARFTTSIPEPGATIRHILTHTSEGVPGTLFHYDEARFAALTPVIETCYNQPYRRALYFEAMDRFAMADSVPGQDLDTPEAVPPDMFTEDVLLGFHRTFLRLAKPYRVDRAGRAALSAYPPKEINASTGVISTVRDLARFNAGLDRLALLRLETLTAAYTPAVTSDGHALPVGLGWFTQVYNGERVVWHFGNAPDAFSSLIVKLPSRRLTMILLANTDRLNAGFPLAEGDVTISPFARLFLRMFQTHVQAQHRIDAGPPLAPGA